MGLQAGGTAEGQRMGRASLDSGGLGGLGARLDSAPLPGHG